MCGRQLICCTGFTARLLHPCKLLHTDDEEAAAADAGQQLDGHEVKQEAVASVYEVEDRPSSAAVDEKPDTQAKPSTSGLNKKEGFGNVVHIVDMTWYTTDIEVEAACAPYGRVLNIKFFEDRSNGRSAGTCIVEFSSHDEARACIEGLNKTKVGDREVQVSWPGKHKTPVVRRCAQPLPFKPSCSNHPVSDSVLRRFVSMVSSCAGCQDKS